jgi:hypothetical protein
MYCVYKDIRVTRLYYFPELSYLHLALKANVEYSLENVEADFKAINELKKDKRIFVLIDMGDASFEHIPKNVMKYMAESPYRKNHIKIALITPGLGTKIFGNFYVRVFKPETTTRIFNDVPSAWKWLGMDKQMYSEIEQALQDNS